MFLGVGWGNNVHVLAHSHDVTPRHVHLHVRTCVMLRWRCVTSRRGGVGWGNNVHVLTHSHDVTPRHVHLHVRTYVMLRSVDILSRKRTKIEWPHLDVRSHMAVAMGGKCSWKSLVGENRCVLSEDVEITGKNGYRWGFGHADFPKGTFFALRHVNYIQ